ncbi:MAG: 4Fe-4S binding protein [Syntrophomonadaceae bacterium]|nr:4Fe-4S binding protein [Syntrophomonadaceae bacterium]
MRYSRLGRTGLVVSRLCLGVLTIGPLQENLSVEEGSRVIIHALSRGINFLDTAESYDTYPYIRRALEQSPVTPVIATKSYAYTREGMRDSVERARDTMGVRTIDIFLLHEQESEYTLLGHQEALSYLLEAKRKGVVRAVGLSTHSVKGVLAGAQHPEIDVIHPLINRAGLGILNGSREQMLAAITLAHQLGKGLYGMKALGGGNLLPQAWRAFTFVNGIPWLDAMAVGMKSIDEVELNLAWIEGRRDTVLENKVSGQMRRLHIEAWCSGCGSCVENCRYGALHLKNDRAEIETEKCILCGYCSRYCPDFCIKII